MISRQLLSETKTNGSLNYNEDVLHILILSNEVWLKILGLR